MLTRSQTWMSLVHLLDHARQKINQLRRHQRTERKETAIKLAKDDTELQEVLWENGFSQIPYPIETKLKLGYNKWRRRDRLGNEHYVTDYSNGDWQHIVALGNHFRTSLDSASGQGAMSLDQRLSQFQL